MDNLEDIKKRDFEGENERKKPPKNDNDSLYLCNDVSYFLQFDVFNLETLVSSLKTLEELIEKDKQREKDGFPKRIKIGKIVKPLQGNKAKVVVVPTTSEPKFYHDDSITEDDEQSTGGSGGGEEGEVIGKQRVDPHQGEGSGQGAGDGESEEHD
ncbi:MAG TPA: hypothetical protein ENN45_01480, partial [Bacteroidetes bacterium]|nr:hypothetical protein [Bacteroidota bacterium]